MVTKEALDSLTTPSTSDRAIPITVNHDPFCMPIGKIIETWVEPFQDGYAAVSKLYFDDEPNILGFHSEAGTSIVCLDFEKDPRPFLRPFASGEHVGTRLNVDPSNFDSIESYDLFYVDVGLIDSSIGRGQPMLRHSLIPEPIIQLVVSNPDLTAAMAIGLWSIRRVEKFVRYTVDETLKKTADGISDSLSDTLRKIYRAYSGRKSNDDRPILTDIVLPGDIDIRLLARTNNNEELPEIDLGKITKEIEKYGRLLQEAEEVTLARNGTNDWEFLYMKLRSGKVIGTLECYESTMEKLRKNSQTGDQDILET